MTFTEAAIEVLRREGKPLHFKKIAEIAARESLLEHVGKVPEETMADQLAAHCRLPRTERRLWAVQHGTFALAEWGLDEDPHGFEQLVETPPENEPAYRSRERHPVPSRELARAAPRGEGRGEGRGRRREEGERREKRFPPPAEVAYEILAGAGHSLTVSEIAAEGAQRMLMPDAFVRDGAALTAALAEDNRRRESAGRHPLFQLDGDAVTLIAQPEPGERPAPVVAAAVRAVAPGDVRRTALAAVRRRLRECDGPSIEWIAGRMLEKLGYRELKVAKRGREHVILTARRKLGLADVRHAIRVLRTGAEAGRRDITDTRRDLGHYGAQIGVVVTAGDAARDARGEAATAGQLPVLLVCGEAFAEALAESGVGCVPVVVPEIDEAFFKSAAEEAEKDEVARRARREERDRREGREGREDREDREDRDGREDREDREARESRDGRDGREKRREDRRGEREGRREGRREERVRADETPAVSAVEEPQATARAEREPTVIEIAGSLTTEVPAELDAELDAGDDDEGDDEGEGTEGGAEVSAADAGAAAGGEAGASSERRRRRRRRRRRGGRGRGREGAATAGEPGAPAPPAAGGEGAPASAAAQQSDAPAPAPAEAAPAPERVERAEPAAPPAEPPPHEGGEGS
jgi:ribonuclease E